MGYGTFADDLSGQVALVTGANRGMGKETARELARMGAEVIRGCRVPPSAPGDPSCANVP